MEGKREGGTVVESETRDADCPSHLQTQSHTCTLLCHCTEQHKRERHWLRGSGTHQLQIQRGTDHKDQEQTPLTEE